MEEKIKEKNAKEQVLVGRAPIKANNSDDEQKDPKMTAPVDYEFQLGMMETGLVENELALPRAADGLFVTRPIDKYEPLI